MVTKMPPSSHKYLHTITLERSWSMLSEDIYAQLSPQIHKMLDTVTQFHFIIFNHFQFHFIKSLQTCHWSNWWEADWSWFMSSIQALQFSESSFRFETLIICSCSFNSLSTIVSNKVHILILHHQKQEYHCIK